MSFDDLILGGGPAGRVIAARLSEDPDRGHHAAARRLQAAMAAVDGPGAAAGAILERAAA